MSRLKPPFGTTTELTNNVVQEREIAADTTLDRLVYGDGVLPAGKPLAFLADVGGAPISSAMTPVVQAPTLAAAMELLDQGAFTATGGSAARNLADRSAERVNLKDFGATGDGSTDDTTAIQAWLVAITAGKVGYAPAGTYKFTAALSKALSAFAIVGDGPYQTIFKYAGASTTIDLITIGDGASGYNSVYLHGFRIASDTTMTAGTGLRIRKLGRSSVHSVTIDGQDGNGKLYHGIWFNEVDNVDFVDWDVKAAADGIRVNGGNDGRAGLMLFCGKVLHCAVGLRVGGDFGGLYIDQGDIIENDINVVIDTTLVATANREIFFSQTAALDSSRVGANLQVSDTLATGSSIIHMDGTWVSAAAQDGILIDASVSMNLMFMGGVLKNSGRDGIRNASTSSIIVAAPSRCTTNAGYGINSTAVNANIYVGGAVGYWASNSSGNVNANVVIAALLGQNGTVAHGGVNTFPNTGLRVFDTNASHSLGFVPGSNLTADRALTITTGDSDRTLVLDTWTAYTPTITSGSGTFTTTSAVGAWQRVGTAIHVRVAITITTNGTAATDVRFSLPATSAGNVTGIGGGGAGRNNTTGPMLQCFIPASSTIAVLNQYDNTYPGADGYLLLAWATYEG